MARTNRRYAAERMTRNNPMYRQECRERVQATLRSMQHQPKIRGGNGQVPPEPQRRLHQALGSEWRAEFVVLTKLRHQGYPTHYKIDLAYPAAKVAIEIDGASHSAATVRARDGKKEQFLRQNGWLVLRFSNQEVMADTVACARMVTSITSR